MSVVVYTAEQTRENNRRMDNPGCCGSYCQTEIEAGTQAKNNLLFVFDDWPFQLRSVIAATRQASLYLKSGQVAHVATKIVSVCLPCYFLQSSFPDC